MYNIAFKKTCFPSNQEQLNYGMDSMSLDSGEDSKADDMDEMTMPNPGSIQVPLAWTFVLIVTMLKMKHCLYHWWWILSRVNSWKEEWVDRWKRDIQKAVADVNIRLENIQKTDSNKEITQNKTLTKPSQVLTSTQQHKIRGKHISRKKVWNNIQMWNCLKLPNLLYGKKIFLALLSPFSTNFVPFLALFVHG